MTAIGITNHAREMWVKEAMKNKRGILAVQTASHSSDGFYFFGIYFNFNIPGKCKRVSVTSRPENFLAKKQTPSNMTSSLMLLWGRFIFRHVFSSRVSILTDIQSALHSSCRTSGLFRRVELVMIAILIPREQLK